MKKTSKTRTINAWSAALSTHRQTLEKVLHGVPADGRRGRFKTYTLATVRKALGSHEKSKMARRGLTEGLLLEKIRALEIRNDIADGTIILGDEVDRVISRMLARVDQLLEQKLVNELPATVAGLDCAQAKLSGARLMGELMAEFEAARKALSK